MMGCTELRGKQNFVEMHLTHRSISTQQLSRLSDARADRYGDAALNRSHHGNGHTLCLTALHRAAAAAFGVGAVHREPADCSSFSPGKRPDIHIPHLSTIFDVKTSRLFVKLPAAIATRATHTAFAATTDRFHAASLGRLQRGEFVAELLHDLRGSGVRELCVQPLAPSRGHQPDRGGAELLFASTAPQLERCS